METEMNTNKLLLVCLLLAGTILSKAQNNEVHLNPPQIIKNPSSTTIYSSENRKFTGIPSMAVSPGGRKWCVWYAGPFPGEDLNNYVVVATSRENDKTWEEVLVIDPDGPGKVRAYDPEVWIDPMGKLWVFWAQATALEKGTGALVTEGTSAGVWAIITDNPESGNPDWDSPFRITDGVMMCKPTVLSTGEWTLPVSMWKKEPHHARMVVSENKGRTWSVRGGASVPDSVRSFDENSIIERKDGSLWMLIRTKYGIGESISTDRGFTWSPVIPSEILHPSARFFISFHHIHQLMSIFGRWQMHTQNTAATRQQCFIISDGLGALQSPKTHLLSGNVDILLRVSSDLQDEAVIRTALMKLPG